MSEQTTAPNIHSQVLPLGGAAAIDFHFAAGSLEVRLVAADAAAGRIELALSNMRGAYDMLHRATSPSGDRWTPLDLGADGQVHAALDLQAGDRIYIVAEGMRTHAIELLAVDWTAGGVALRWREMP